MVNKLQRLHRFHGLRLGVERHPCRRDAAPVRLRLDFSAAAQRPGNASRRTSPPRSLSFAVGTMLMTGVKGNTMHRTLGYGWMVTMGATAISSLFLTGLSRQLSELDPCLLSAWTLIVLPMGVAAARRHSIKRAPPDDDRCVHGRHADRRPLHLPAGPPDVEPVLHDLIGPARDQRLTAVA
jgi:hypothetical protein